MIDMEFLSLAAYLSLIALLLSVERSVMILLSADSYVHMGGTQTGSKTSMA